MVFTVPLRTLQETRSIWPLPGRILLDMGFISYLAESGSLSISLYLSLCSLLQAKKSSKPDGPLLCHEQEKHSLKQFKNK